MARPTKKEQTLIANELRNKGVPAEWAILIAQRADGDHRAVSSYPSAGEFLWCAFVWAKSPEGHDFWQGVADALAREAEQP